MRLNRAYEQHNNSYIVIILRNNENVKEEFYLGS